jgi:hypothetical protein
VRVVAVADSDSYVKWAAAMLGRMPADWQVSLVIVRSAKQPSRGQLASALDGSRLTVDDVTTLPFDRAVTHVASEHADVVLVATIGPLADLVTEAVLDHSTVAPVIVSGVPGIALPARRKALIYRSQARLVVLHSLREVRLFEQIAAHNSLPQRFALATLPFLAELGGAGDPRGPVVFAAQAIVPPTRAQRLALLRSLSAFACRFPHLRVIIKVRALAGEGQTHAERFGYADLLREEFARVPPNLVVEVGPMAEHLRQASALVTVSSTAAIEAVALGIPTLVIDDFGVSAELINEVFTGSGLLGGTAELMARNFHDPDPAWLADNYFHDPSQNTWIASIEGLVAENRAGTLQPLPRVVRGGGGALRRAWDRKRALGSADRSIAGLVALAIGMPARVAVLALHGLAGPLRSGPVPLQHEAAELREGRSAADHTG